jgi:hypothetical protein
VISKKECGNYLNILIFDALIIYKEGNYSNRKVLKGRYFLRKEGTQLICQSNDFLKRYKDIRP